MKIVLFKELDFRVEPYEWQWSADHRAWIDEHFARMQEQRSQLWNGRVLMLRDYKIEGQKISGTFFETDFASMVAFRAMGFPDNNALLCAAGVALRSSDGAYILGVMSHSTANAGRIYFVAGTPDMNDLRPGGVVDLIGSTVRELGEEAGLREDEVRFTGQWHAIRAGGRLALLRATECALTEAELVARIRSYIASQKEPELSDVVSVRSAADFSPAMPDFIRGYLSAMLSGSEQE